MRSGTESTSWSVHGDRMTDMVARYQLKTTTTTTKTERKSVWQSVKLFEKWCVIFIWQWEAVDAKIKVPSV